MEQPTPQEIAQNWVTWLDALASGQYKKTTCQLHDIVRGEERHCCLGVAQICLGLSKYYGGTDKRLIPMLGLDGIYGRNRTNNVKLHITTLNDNYYDMDDDFTNMHIKLLEDIEGFTRLHPEVAPLVRKMLAERNT